MCVKVCVVADEKTLVCLPQRSRCEGRSRKCDGRQGRRAPSGGEGRSPPGGPGAAGASFGSPAGLSGLMAAEEKSPSVAGPCGSPPAAAAPPEPSASQGATTSDAPGDSPASLSQHLVAGRWRSRVCDPLWKVSAPRVTPFSWCRVRVAVAGLVGGCSCPRARTRTSRARCASQRSLPHHSLTFHSRPVGQVLKRPLKPTASAATDNTRDATRCAAGGAAREAACGGGHDDGAQQ